MDRTVNGLSWPEYDILHAFTAWKGEPLKAVDPLLSERRIAVQAGGTVGVTTRELCKRFGAIYVFEPDADNFRHLVMNCPEPKVAKLQAALGEVHGMAGMQGMRQDCASFFIDGKGLVPVLRVDDFKFPFLDLLYLDCEGFEALAIRGGKETIERCKPVIFCRQETKGWKYGFEGDDIDRELAKLNYTVAHEETTTPFAFKVYKYETVA